MALQDRYWYPCFAQSLIALSKKKVVVDIGTYARFYGMPQDIRPLFGDNYKAVGIVNNTDLDYVASIYEMPFLDCYADGVICLQVFEHLQEPFKAADEIYRIMTPGGEALITVPFMEPKHGQKSGGDFFRYTDEGLRYVFKKFSKIEIMPQGGGCAYRLALFPRLFQMFDNRIGMKIIKRLDALTSSQTTRNWMVNLIK